MWGFHKKGGFLFFLLVGGGLGFDDGWMDGCAVDGFDGVFLGGGGGGGGGGPRWRIRVACGESRMSGFEGVES